MTKVTITAENGQVVDCFGEWDEDSNALCVFDDGDYGCEDFFADGADSWQDAVNIMARYAADNGMVLVEMKAC